MSIRIGQQIDWNGKQNHPIGDVVEPVPPLQMGKMTIEDRRATLERELAAAIQQPKTGFKSVTFRTQIRPGETTEQTYARIKAAMDKCDFSDDVTYPWRQGGYVKDEIIEV